MLRFFIFGFLLIRLALADGIETAVRREMARQHAPGCAVAVLHRGKVVMLKCFGVRDLETKAAVTPGTLFRIGSTTKILTAIAIMRQVEQGSIRLDEPVVTYVPEFFQPEVTVRQLLSHTAGLKDSAVLYGPEDPAALKAHVAAISQADTFAPPGAVFSYSNLSLDAAGEVLERVVGQSFPDHLEQKLFPVLGMHRATFSTQRAITFPFAVGYEDGKPVRPNPHNSTQNPSGFCMATIVDEVALMRALLGHKPALRPEGLKEMRTGVLGLPPLDMEYGLGLFCLRSRGYRTYGHDGNIDGYTSFLTTVPDLDLGVAVLTNVSNFDAEPIFEAVLDSMSVPRSPAARVVPHAMTDYAGQYQMGDVTVTITEQGMVLGEQTFTLKPISPDGFKASNGMVLAFLRDSGGQVRYLNVGYRSGPRLLEVR